MEQAGLIFFFVSFFILVMSHNLMIIFIISYIGRKILTRIIGHYCHLVAVYYIAYAFEKA